jgi:hypothetical protein
MYLVVILDEVPCIPLQFLMHGRMLKVHKHLKEYPLKPFEESVESEMVHMRMGHKNIGNLIQIRWSYGVYVTEIEKNSLFFMQKSDEKTGVIEMTIEQPGVKNRFHQ